MNVWSRCLKFAQPTALCMSLMVFTPGAMAPLEQAAPTPSSNVLFVLTDDMTLADLQFMPQVAGLIADQGMSFDNEFDNVTLCCPARTSILRGQYSHNTGVLTNGGSNGGFETAHADNLEQSTVATAMRDAGYTTALFGKYLNGYPNTVSPSYIPPGWDTWASSIKGNAYGEYKYTLNENGKPRFYGDQPQDYGTDVYVGQAKAFINQAAQKGQPFFAYLAVYAPHQPATPANQDLNTFPGLQAPRTAAFNEANVQRQAPIHPRPAAPQPATTAQYRQPLPPARSVAPGRRPWRRGPRQSAAPERPARQHLHHLHVRQRLPPGPAPHAFGQDDRLRD